MAQKKRLLYLALNDGSDSRINKELRTLSREYEVWFLGMGSTVLHAFSRHHCRKFRIIKGRKSNPFALPRYLRTFLAFFLFRRFSCVYVADKKLLNLLYPFLALHKKVVLDLFDAAPQPKQYSSRLYRLAHTIFVTSEERKAHLPEKYRHKATVLPNYPIRVSVNGQAKFSETDGNLYIFYYGNLCKERGTHFLNNLLQADSRIRVIMAGWQNDEESYNLSHHKQAYYYGILGEKHATRLARQCDYMLCVQEPPLQGKVHSGTQQVYVAIQAQTPVLINKEAPLADYVGANGYGWVINDLVHVDEQKLAGDLLSMRGKFVLPGVKEGFTWEDVEEHLLV